MTKIIRNLAVAAAVVYVASQLLPSLAGTIDIGWYDGIAATVTAALGQ